MKLRSVKRCLLATGVALSALCLVAACGGDDDDAPPGEETEATSASPTSTPDLELEAERSADQEALDEAIGAYFAANFPQEPAYVGDCETLAEATCSQFRGLDSDGFEYFIVGDPQTFEAAAWLIVQRAGEGWEVVGHDLSRGWARGDQALVAPGECQNVFSEPGTGEPLECLAPATVVTVTGGPRLANGSLYFRIEDERWILGTGLCDPAIDDDCEATA
ncbi:MAG TPA: hypothetical protein VFZ12_09125 [Dehalococcoidia bacterium]|nr:hypothetical protein [Dehalococcoidia bacterium]